MHNQNGTVSWEVATLLTVWILIFIGHIYLIETVSTLSSGTATAKDAFLSNGGMLTAVAVNPN